MKRYKHVTLNTTSGNKINIPKEIWKNLGWKPNDKLRVSYGLSSPCDDADPVSLHIELAEDYEAWH